MNTPTTEKYTLKPATGGLWTVHGAAGPVHPPESLRLAKSRMRDLNKAASKQPA